MIQKSANPYIQAAVFFVFGIFLKKVDEILALDVESFLLACVETGWYKFKIEVFIGFIVERNRTKISSEFVQFLTIVIHI